MKKTALLLLILLLKSTTIGYASAYTNDTYAFTITPPDGWTTEEPEYAAVVFHGPTENGYTINIKIQAETTTLTLEEYANTILQDMPKALENFHLLAQANTTINTINATILEYNFTDRGTAFQQKQAMLIKDTMAYTVTYAAPQNAYAAYLQEYENSLQTLNIYYTAPETPQGIDWAATAVAITILAAIAIIIAIFIRRRRKQQKTQTQPSKLQPPHNRPDILRVSQSLL